MLTKHNLLFSPKPSPYLYQHHYLPHISLSTILLNSQLTTNSLVFPISIPQPLLQFHHQNLLHQKDLNQKSKSPNLHPMKIFKFQKTLLKQLQSLQRKIKLQPTNTIISRLSLKTVTQIQSQKQVYPPQTISAHPNNLLQTQSPKHVGSGPNSAQKVFWKGEGCLELITNVRTSLAGDVGLTPFVHLRSTHPTAIVHN